MTKLAKQSYKGWTITTLNPDYPTYHNGKRYTHSISDGYNHEMVFSEDAAKKIIDTYQ